MSDLKFNQDFYAGYSPERINPSDKLHRVTNILKITLESTPEVAEFVDQVYNLIIEAGTHKASSFKVTEVVKVIENTQSDVNIALINELAIIFNKIEIDTEAVLKAASTKWSFYGFAHEVGGHCIGVDPYYLTHKVQSLGLHPKVILVARRLNDRIGEYVATQLIKEMVQALKEYGLDLDIYAPWVNTLDAVKEYGRDPIFSLAHDKYDAIILAVVHDFFKQMTAIEIHALDKSKHVPYDLKYLFSEESTSLCL